MADSDVIYRRDTYVPLVGSGFAVHRGDADAVGVELVEATELPSRGECFSLVFRGDSTTSLEQRTYLVEHRELGEFPLFLVPVGPDEGGNLRFEAVVNRLGGQSD
jgi:hypothetical protein